MKVRLHTDSGESNHVLILSYIFCSHDAYLMWISHH